MDSSGVLQFQKIGTTNRSGARGSHMNPSADNDTENNGLSYSDGGGESGLSGSRCDDDGEYFGEDTYSMDNGQISDIGGDLNSLCAQSSTEVIGYGAEDGRVEIYADLPQYVDQSEFVSQMPTEALAENNISNVEVVAVRKDGSMSRDITATTDVKERKRRRQRSINKTKPKKKVKQLSASALKKARFANYYVG